MRVITSDYLKNKINKLEKTDYLCNLKSLNFEEKVVAINKMIDDNIILTKSIRNNVSSYDQDNHLKVEVKQELNGIKNKIKICKDYLQLLKKQHVLDLENIKFTKIDVENDVINLTYNQIKLLDDVLNHHLNKYNMDDLLVVIKYIIANYSMIDYEEITLSSLKKIINSISFDDNENNEDIVIGLNSIKCEINNKLAKLDKYDSERIILNQLKDLIKQVISISKIEFMKNYDYKFDIIEYWLTDEINKLFIEKIFERLPECVNIRSKNNEHILIYVLNEYINSFKIELRDQGKPDISSAYLGSIYKLLINNPNLELLDSDDFIRRNLLDDFTQFLKNSHYKRERVLTALKEVEDLEGVKTNSLGEDLFDENEVNDQLMYMRDVIAIENNNRKRIDLTSENAVIIVNSNLKYNNYSYILKKINSQQYNLKINVVDIASLISENSPLDLYLKKQLFSDIINDKFILPEIDRFSLKLGCKMPTITFDMVIDQNGEVSNFECYKSTSMVKDKINSEEILSNSNLSLYYQLLNAFKGPNLIVKDNSLRQLENILNQNCTKGMIKYFDDNNYPFIYKVQNEQDSDNFNRNINALNGIFYKISREDFRVIYSIVCEDYNYAYYSIDNIGHRNKNSNYYSDLLNPLDSYIGIVLQRLIDEFYLSKHQFSNNDYLLNYLKELVEKANDYKIKKREKYEKIN